MLVLSAVLIATVLAVSMYEKAQSVTDPVRAHIPLKAHLLFSFPDPNEPVLMNMIYTLTPLVDLKTNVSEDIVLPEGIVFVENNLPTGQVMLSKGKRYKYNAKIKAVESGIWRIYASPGVYADVKVLDGRVSSIVGQEVFDVSKLPVEFHDIIEVSEEQQAILMDAAKNWLRGYNAQEYGREEFECLRISGNPDISCFGCELKCYSDSTLYGKFYFVIEEDLVTKEIKIRNVYRWAYWTTSGYRRKPVCEEITKAKIIEQGGN